MKKLYSLVAGIFLATTSFSQDTFSICAVDTVTGEVGSAGASCIDASAIAGGCVIISDVHPGVGVIHTQSYWIPANQAYGQSLMNTGLAPAQIIDSLVANDAQGDSTIRQYGVVDLYGGGARTAAFTGSNCFSYKSHITGPNYSIQGNILLGQQILDSMEARFLAEPGDLACKLMAAMQGAKVVGADTRCAPSGNSSLSSFLRVALPGDTNGTYTIDLVVPQGPAGFEPIDSLQTLFNGAHNCPAGIDALQPQVFVNVFPNPAAGSTTIQVSSPGDLNGATFELYDNSGKKMRTENIPANGMLTISGETGGLYHYRVVTANGMVFTGKLVLL